VTIIQEGKRKFRRGEECKRESFFLGINGWRRPLEGRIIEDRGNSHKIWSLRKLFITGGSGEYGGGGGDFSRKWILNLGGGKTDDYHFGKTGKNRRADRISSKGKKRTILGSDVKETYEDNERGQRQKYEPPEIERTP